MNFVTKFYSGILIVMIVVSGIFFFDQLAESEEQSGIISKLLSNNHIVDDIVEGTLNKEEELKLPPHDYKVPIIMYHYIRDYSNPNDKIGIGLSVTPYKFEQQLKWLQENGYETFGVNELDKIARLPQGKKAVMLTFDDGYKDNYTNAFTLLQKYKMKGTFYVITGSVGTEGYATWDNLKEMLDNGMVIGSHSVSHPDLRNSDDKSLENQLKKSKEAIKEHLGIDTNTFCYPAGKYNEKTITKLKELGYQTAVTVTSGVADQKSNHYELPRYRMNQDTSIIPILTAIKQY